MDEEFRRMEKRGKREHQRSAVPKDPPRYECPKCEDRDWVEVLGEDGNIYAKRCGCWAVKRAKQLMERSGISQEFYSKNFNNFDVRNNSQLANAKDKAAAYCRAFLEMEHARNNSIMFYGQVGAGKTHLGTAICGELMRQNIAVTYMSYRNAVTKIKQRLTVTKIRQGLTNELDYDRELAKYTHARVLYIDDLLKGRTTESDVNILYEIVNYRYMNNLPIIVSTEKSIDGLLDFDEATGSRIIEMCRGNIVQLQGKDLNYRLNYRLS